MNRTTPETLDDIVRDNANREPEKTAIVCDGEAVSYQHFYDDIDRAARMLLGLGIEHGDRVGLMFPNVPEFLFLYFGCFRIGAVTVPVNTRYRRAEIEYALGHSECRLLIADKMFADVTEGMEKSVASVERTIIHVEADEPHPEALHHHLKTAPEANEWPQVRADDPAVIFYTSGSTSRPKGVTHTHFSLLGNARIQVDTREISPDTVLLVSTGLGYVAGLSGLTIPAFLSGCTLVLVSDQQPDNLLKAIEHYRANTTLLLPTMLLEMLDSPRSATTDLSSMRSCFVAGDECSHDLYTRYRKRMGHDLLQAFGMTECEGYLSNRPSGPNKVGTVGLPAKGVRVRLVDEKGNDVALGEPGELIVKADSVMQGYWEDPEHTNEALRDGWLFGGDVAVCDEEGFYTFVERKKEIIIHGGSNVGPHEVEDVIDSFPDVKESCVVGVPDAHYGAVLAAYVSWESGVGGGDIDALKRWASERLAAYKVPDHWNVMEELPKTPTGKIDRKALHIKAQEEIRR